MVTLKSIVSKYLFLKNVNNWNNLRSLEILLRNAIWLSQESSKLLWVPLFIICSSTLKVWKWGVDSHRSNSWENGDKANLKKELLQVSESWIFCAAYSVSIRNWHEIQQICHLFLWNQNKRKELVKLCQVNAYIFLSEDRMSKDKVLENPLPCIGHFLTLCCWNDKYYMWVWRTSSFKFSH